MSVCAHVGCVCVCVCVCVVCVVGIVRLALGTHKSQGRTREHVGGADEAGVAHEVAELLSLRVDGRDRICVRRKMISWSS